MKLKMICVLLVLLSMSLWAESPEHQFKSVLSFEGTWEGEYDGQKIRLTYEPISGGSAVLERMTWVPDGSSMTTVYHAQGDQLMATHYCKKNQPRLVSVPGVQPGVIELQFVDGAKEGESHLAHLRLKRINANELEQTVRFSGNKKEIQIVYKKM